MSNQPQFIFGYGSLVEADSRAMTWPAARYASPAIVQGVERGWFDQVPGQGYSPTYLGAVQSPTHTCNGVIFPVTEQELAAYDKRESGYKRDKIDQSKITMLDGSKAAPAGDIWFYGNQNKILASQKYPIVQSYVDVCLNGCLQLEAGYPLAREHKFAESFIRTTTNWSEWWVNDRIYPRRPFIYVPNASAIDELLISVLGIEAFNKVQIEPASWERH